MARALPALLAVVSFLLATSARAQEGDTYCVGGYEGTPPNVVAACDMPAVRAMHSKWHYHCWVTNGQECFVCYDEEDSTCIPKFLSRSSGTYRRAEPYECARLYGEKHGADNLVAHVIDGKPVTPPPPPPPVQLDARVERISPGPYTAGDEVTVVGAVRDEHGALRRITGGTFRVTDANGQTSEHRGTVQPDGTVSAGFSLPPSSSLRIEFVPMAPPLAQNEQLRAAASEAQSLKVEVCSYRARVVQPTVHEALVAGQSTLLSARLFDAAGQVPVTSPPAGLSLAFTVQVEGEKPGTIPADGSLSAAWTPPASPKPREVRISAGGRAGDRVVCPTEEVTATVSDLGLGFDTSELPRTCYAGLPCRGTVRLLRPAPGTGRQQVDALLADPKVEARMVDTGEVRYSGPPRPDDRYEFSVTYAEPQAASWSVVFQTPRGPILDARARSAGAPPAQAGAAGDAGLRHHRRGHRRDGGLPEARLQPLPGRRGAPLGVARRGARRLPGSPGAQLPQCAGTGGRARLVALARHRCVGPEGAPTRHLPGGASVRRGRVAGLGRAARGAAHPRVQGPGEDGASALEGRGPGLPRLPWRVGVALAGAARLRCAARRLHPALALPARHVHPRGRERSRHATGRRHPPPRLPRQQSRLLPGCPAGPARRWRGEWPHPERAHRASRHPRCRCGADRAVAPWSSRIAAPSSGSR